jgi:hypothetical protein
MGNGAKAASKRERNAKDAGSVAKSQLKSVGFLFYFAAACPLFLRQKAKSLLSKLTFTHRT